jgi:hypothetical protein
MAIIFPDDNHHFHSGSNIFTNLHTLSNMIEPRGQDDIRLFFICWRYYLGGSLRFSKVKVSNKIEPVNQITSKVQQIGTSKQVPSQATSTVIIFKPADGINL